MWVSTMAIMCTDKERAISTIVDLLFRVMTASKCIKLVAKLPEDGHWRTVTPSSCKSLWELSDYWSSLNLLRLLWLAGTSQLLCLLTGTFAGRESGICLTNTSHYNLLIVMVFLVIGLYSHERTHRWQEAIRRSDGAVHSPSIKLVATSVGWM